MFTDNQSSMIAGLARGLLGNRSSDFATGLGNGLLGMDQGRQQYLMQLKAQAEQEYLQKKREREEQEWQEEQKDKKKKRDLLDQVGAAARNSTVTPYANMGLLGPMQKGLLDEQTKGMDQDFMGASESGINEGLASVPGRFDPMKFKENMQPLMAQIDPIAFLKSQEKERGDPNKPINPDGSPNTAYQDWELRKIAATKAATEKRTAIELELDAAGITDPAERSRIIKQGLEKKTTHAPSPFGTNAIAGVDAQGKPIFFQPGKDGKPSIIEGITPTPKAVSEKALPTSAAQKIFENQSNLRRAQQALELTTGKTIDGKPLPLVGGKTPSGQTPDAEATGWKGFAPEFALQRLDPKGVDTRAAISDLGSMIIHDRSGAAVTAAEFPRLRPFIPLKTDDAKTVEKKLRRFVTEYEKITTEMADFYEESGYRVPRGSLQGSGASGSWQGKRMTQADIAATAAKSGKTTKEVMDAAIAKGFQIE